MRTLSFRIAAILVAGFVLLQLIYVVTLALPGRLDDRGGYGLPPPRAFAHLVRSIETAAPESGRRLVETFDGSLFALEIRDRAPGDFREVSASLRPLAIAYRRVRPARSSPPSLHRPALDRARQHEQRVGDRRQGRHRRGLGAHGGCVPLLRADRPQLCRRVSGRC